MNNILQNIIIKEIKKLLNKAITKHSEIIEGDKYSTYIYIKSCDDQGNPILKILNKKKKIFKDIDFKDISIYAKFGIGTIIDFDIDNQLPIWIKKFILMSCYDKGIQDITKPFYLIKAISTNDVVAFMYIDNKEYEEVSIDYILKTS